MSTPPNRSARMKGGAKAAAQPTKPRPFPYAKVAELWAKGKTIAEIAKAIGRVGEGRDPHHAMRVTLTRMHRGYRAGDGKLTKLPYRISRTTLRRATAAGKKSVK
jgi:hypothetical protein